MLLAMAEEVLGHDDHNLLWDEQSWEFPNLGGDHGQEDCGEKKLAETSNSPGGKALLKDDQEAQPSLPPAAKGKKRSAAATKKGGGDEEENEGKGGGDYEHELHIWTERERRKKMRNMFANLHALLPHLPPKADKSTIVDEAVTYIKKLQETLQNLQKQKLERFHGLAHIVGPISFDPSIFTQQRLATQSREAFLAEQGAINSNSAVALANINALFTGPELPAIFKTWTSPNVTLNICGRDAHFSICSVKKPGLLTAICFVMEKHKLEVVSVHVSSGLNGCMYMFHAHANGAPDQYPQAFAVEDIYKQAAAEIMLWVNS